MSAYPPPAPATVLLVMLPASPNGSRVLAPPDLRALQHQLGPAVRVLPITEASHPAVVSSFAPAELPTCVLVRQGVELWRQPGWPDSGQIGAVMREQT